VAGADLVVLDAATGETRATLGGLGQSTAAGGLILAAEAIVTSPVVADGTVYVAVEAGLVAIRGTA
jgi:hypothetical protein